MILKTFFHVRVHQAPVTSPAMHPDDMMRRHREEEHNPLERPQAPEEEEKRWLQTAPRAQIMGEILFFKSRLGWTTKHRKSPLAISRYRLTDISERGQQEAQRRGETTPLKKTSGGTRQLQQHDNKKHREGGRLPHSRRLRGVPDSYNNTSRRPRGGCDQPATARDGVV